MDKEVPWVLLESFLFCFVSPPRSPFRAFPRSRLRPPPRPSLAAPFAAPAIPMSRCSSFATRTTKAVSPPMSKPKTPGAKAVTAQPKPMSMQRAAKKPSLPSPHSRLTRLSMLVCDAMLRMPIGPISGGPIIPRPTSFVPLVIPFINRIQVKACSQRSRLMSVMAATMTCGRSFPCPSSTA